MTNVVGLDPNPGVEKFARPRISAASIPIELRTGRAEQLPFPDHSFDTVVTTLNNTIRNAVAGMPNVQILDTSAALNGRRLCENTVGLLEERGIATWRSPGAVDNTEWVSQIRTTSTLFGPYQLQEDLHPSYWGEKALRNCVRQAYNGGTPRGGVCTHGTGLNANGEPNATLS